MTKALLIVPHFWDPVCVPLGISSLKAYAEQRGHSVDLFDFNTMPEIFGAQRAYFEEGKQQFPAWRNWNIERNGCETLSLHQILFLYARNRADYIDLVCEVLNMNGAPLGDFVERLQLERFDDIFLSLYRRIVATIQALLAEKKPDVVGCSLFNSTWPATLFILKRIKALAPDVRTVVGGPGPIMGVAACAESVQRFMDAHDFIDYFVLGEGEAGFAEILDNPSLSRGIIGTQAGSERSLQIDELPLPDYGELAVEKYLQLSIATSRGCPFECSFCAETVFWNKFRSGDRTHLFDSMDALARKHGRRQFYLCDSLSNTSITSLTNHIAQKQAGYLLDCYLRADPICTDRKRTKRWREGGLFRARLGMESASQRILDAMTKMTKPDTMAKSLQSLSGEGIKTSTLWIVCYPGESTAEFNTTLDFIRENRSNIFQADAWLFQYHPHGLAHSKEIDAARGSRPRFSGHLNEILAVTPYVVADDLGPAERFERLEEFVRNMRQLNIPNPYSVYEWLGAERRWQEFGRTSDCGIRDLLCLNA